MLWSRGVGATRCAALAGVLASSLPLAAVAVRDGLLDADQLYVIGALVEALRADGRDANGLASVEGALVDAAVAEPGADLVPLAIDLWADLAPDATDVPWDAEPDLLDVSWPASPTDPRVPEPTDFGGPKPAHPVLKPADPRAPGLAKPRVPEPVGAAERGAEFRVLEALGPVGRTSPPSVRPHQQARRAPDSPYLSSTGRPDPDGPGWALLGGATGVSGAECALLGGATGVSESVAVPATALPEPHGAAPPEPSPRARRACSDTRTPPVSHRRVLVLGRRGPTRGRAPPT